MSVRHFAARVLGYARARRAFVTRAQAIEFSPFLPPWSAVRRGGDPISQLRRRVLVLAWRRVTSRPDRFVLACFGLAWPFRTALAAAGLVRQHGSHVRRASGQSRLQQWVGCVRCANTLNLNPRTYFSYRCYLPAIQAREVIQVSELAVLQLADIAGANLRVLDDKLYFADRCAEVQLPTPPIVAALLPGEPERWPGDANGTLPRRDLFLKWIDSELGVGAERWTYDAESNGWRRRDARKSNDELMAHCRSRAAQRGMLVQESLENHPDIRALSGETLCTLRVITFRDPKQPATFIRAAFKLARIGADVDNVNAGGLSCAVDPATYTLGLARGRMPSDGEHERHPDTGQQIRGTRLTVAADAIALALRAHERLEVPWSVGWDVAMTPTGPVLVEGNPLWSARGAQAPHGMPFPESFTTRLLARLSDGRDRSGSSAVLARPYRVDR